MTKNIKGYCFDIGLTILGRFVEIGFHPFCWNKPMLCVPVVKEMGAWHLCLGCFHIWGFKSRGLLGVKIDLSYLHFWADAPTCPGTMKRIF